MLHQLAAAGDWQPARVQQSLRERLSGAALAAAQWHGCCAAQSCQRRWPAFLWVMTALVLFARRYRVRGESCCPGFICFGRGGPAPILALPFIVGAPLACREKWSVEAIETYSWTVRTTFMLHKHWCKWLGMGGRCELPCSNCCDSCKACIAASCLLPTVPVTGIECR